MPTTEEVRAFQKLIQPLLPDWKSFEVRAIVQRGRADQWILNCLKAVIGSPEPWNQVAEGLPRLPDLLVHREVKSIEKLRPFIESLSEGDLFLGEEHIDLRRPNSNPSNPSLYVRKWSRGEARSQFGIDFTCIVLSGGDSVQDRLLRDDLDTLDARLRAADPPWDGLADLRRTFVGIERSSASRRDWASFEIIAPVGVHMSDHEIEDRSVSVKVRSLGSVDSGGVVLSLVAEIADGKIARLRHAFSEGEKGSGLSAVFEFPKPLVGGGLALTYRGIEADRLELHGRVEPSANPRLAVLEELVGGADSLLQGLGGASGKRLEEWASLLFDALGLSVVRYGFLPDDAPDLIAFPNFMRWFLVIECTSREPDLGGKLTKLSTRSKELSRRTGLNAYPVIVSGLDRALINKTDLEKAAKELIAVVSANEFSELMTLALRGAETKEVRAYLEGLIPRGSDMYPYWPK